MCGQGSETRSESYDIVKGECVGCNKKPFTKVELLIG